MPHRRHAVWKLSIVITIDDYVSKQLWEKVVLESTGPLPSLRKREADG